MSKKVTTMAAGAAFAATLAAGAASAAENPFAMTELQGGYQVAMSSMPEGSCGGKDAEGKCGDKGKEGKCGDKGDKGKEEKCGGA